MREPTKSELELVTRTSLHVTNTAERYDALMPSDRPPYPIPFFGRLATARILTLGLNPSAKEFATSRLWPTQMQADTLAERLVGYFDSNDPPPHQWFKEWSNALEGIGSSYRTNAAHIDLSPRATRSASQFRREPLKSVFLDMLRNDSLIWIAALRAAPEAVCILAAGSASNKHYINEFIRDELREVELAGEWRRGRGSGQSALHTLLLPGGREIPLFFCSTGPSARNASVLSHTVCSNSDNLRRVVRR